MRALLPCLAVLVAAGCDLSRFAARTTSPLIRRGGRALDEEADVELARVAAPAQLEQAEGLLVSIPDDRDLLEVLARGYTLFAFGFVEDDLLALGDALWSAPKEASVSPAGDGAARRQVLVSRATALYDRALDRSLRLVATFDRHFPDAFLSGGAALDGALERIPRRAALGITYAGMALASGINLNRGDASRLADLPKALALLKRARALAPQLADGGAAMVLGILYARPPALGGDPPTARRYFEEAIAATDGSYLMARVMFAHAWAVAVRDRAVYRATLEAVLATPGERAPEYRLANEMAKRRAAYYLAQTDQLF